MKSILATFQTLGSECGPTLDTFSSNIGNFIVAIQCSVCRVGR